MSDDTTTSYLAWPSTPLPVELIAFNAEADPAGSIQLKWSTATETNRDRFVLLRSVDGGEETVIFTTAAACH